MRQIIRCCNSFHTGVTSANPIPHTSVEYPVMMETMESPPTPPSGCNHTKNRIITPKGLCATTVSVANIVNSVIPYSYIPNYSCDKRSDSSSHSGSKEPNSQSPPSKKISDIAREDIGNPNACSPEQQQCDQPESQLIAENIKSSVHDLTVPPTATTTSTTTTTPFDERQRVFLLNKMIQGTSANCHNSLVLPEDPLIKETSHFSTSLDASSTMSLPSASNPTTVSSFFLTPQRLTNSKIDTFQPAEGEFVLKLLLIEIGGHI